MSDDDTHSRLELLEQNCPNAIWNIECKLDYISSSVEVLKNNGYIK